MKFEIIKNVFYAIVIAALAAVALVVIAGKFGIGGVRALVVQSGSMSPSINKNSIVVTYPTSSYEAGDVVTYRQSGRADVLVTHRVQSVTKGQFVTKGDANEEADGESVPSRDIVGEVIFSVPFVGAVVNFAKTTQGFILLIAVPSVVVIYSEILNIKRILSEFLKKRKKGKFIKEYKYE